MIQREVTDTDNTKWTCVQAFSGMQKELAEKAADIAEENGLVPVVCTPGGGAQSVRLQLKDNWQEEISDEQLLEAISKASRG